MMGQSRTRLLGVTVLIAMFVVGGLTGAVVQRTALAANTQPRTQQRGPSLFEQLDLSAAQQKKVCALMQRKRQQMKPHEVAIQEAWKEHEPAVRAIIDATNADMDSVLTPEQRAKKDEFRAERQKYFQERDGQSHKTDPRRGARPTPGNPLGVICPGLNDGTEPRGPAGPHGLNWGGDSAPERSSVPAPTPAKPQYEI